jgi:hypothetical protein
MGVIFLIVFHPCLSLNPGLLAWLLGILLELFRLYIVEFFILGCLSVHEFSL